ncbi:hypothetical protein Trihar35433_1276 [Trichoderma harzianum]|nr:hypothetical protein Trihar35433_1276 [Trichoderma harzianum]
MRGSENIPLNFDNPRKALVRKHGRDAAKNMFSMASNTLQELTASPQGINRSDRKALINFNAFREGYNATELPTNWQRTDNGKRELEKKIAALESELRTERDLSLTLRQTVASQGKRIDELEKRNARVTGKVDTLKGHVKDLQDYTVEVTADLVEEVKPTTTRRVRREPLGPGF